MSTTRAGTLLKQQIPIRTFEQWNQSQPGFVEADLVAHCGPQVEGRFLWTLTLTVSPQLHERVHHDANRVDHSCAVTFVASGSYDHSLDALHISAPVHLDEFSIPELTPLWVRSVFLAEAVLEHAPPV